MKRILLIMINGEQEFLQAMENIVPMTFKEEFRAYYDDTDKILYLLANVFPDNNNWIEITKLQYQTLECQWLWVEKGKIIKKTPTYEHHFGLTKSVKGYKIVKNHAGIILEEGDEYLDIEYYDKRNS